MSKKNEMEKGAYKMKPRKVGDRYSCVSFNYFSLCVTI